MNNAYDLDLEQNVLDLEQAWPVINGGLLKLTGKLEGVLNADFEFRVKDYMEIYRIVYKLCTQKPPHNYPQEVYDKYRESVDEYIRHKILPAVNIEADEFSLREFAESWEKYKVMLRFLSNMFYYLDRYFVPKQSLPSLREVGITSFRDRVYLAKRVIAKNVVIERINRERDGEEIDRPLLKDILDIFLETGFGSVDYYKNDFEVAMLEDTRTYYSRKVDFWISELSFTEYLVKAEECLKDERDRVTHYLHSSSKQKLLEIVQNVLLFSHSTHLVENVRSSCHVLLRDDKIEDLSRMYKLFSQIPEGLQLTTNFFEQYVSAEGLKLVERANNAVDSEARTSDIIDRLREDKFLDKVLELHDKYEFYVINVFGNNVIFREAFTKSFELICNSRIAGLNSAEFFATFFDSGLKTLSIQNTAERVEDLLNYVALTKYLSDKVLFTEFWNRKLADRVLFDQCSIADNERRLLLTVKSRIGADVTITAEEMLEDLKEAIALQDHFKVYFDNSNSNIGMDLTVTGLKATLWPPYKSSQLNLPQQLAQSVELFEGFYSEREKHRKLQWKYSLGTGKIMVEFDQKPIEITASTYQIAVVLLFNHSESLSYEEIKSKSNLEDEELAPVLRSLTCGEYKILLKEPNNNEIASTDIFLLNLGFTNTLNEIKIPFQRPDEEKKKVFEFAEAQKVYLVQAALIFIMKRKKILLRETLFSECTLKLAPRFVPPVEMMQKELEKFLLSLYLETGEGDEIRYIVDREAALEAEANRKRS